MMMMMMMMMKRIDGMMTHDALVDESGERREQHTGDIDEPGPPTG